jgi:MoxR-like ATPase
MSAHFIPAEARLHPDFNQTIIPMIKRREDEESIKEECERLIEENKEFYQTIDMHLTINKLQTIDNEIRKQLVNRSLITQQGIRALMTGEHQFIFSAAGVAKSLYANQIFAFFKNSQMFQIQFCPDTTPDDLFGAYDIEKFKKGEIYHNIEGSILTNNFAFLDEFMDGNDKLLRTLLSVLLERKFISGNQVEEALLHTAIATSNYMRVSETTEALLDRFLYKSFIQPAKDMYSLLKIDRVYNQNSGRIVKPSPALLIDIREIIHLKNIIKNRNEFQKIEIPIEIDYLKNLVAVAYEEEMQKYRDNYYMSPRTISKSNDLLKANALFRGKIVADESDVEQLYFLICTINEPLNEDKDIISQDLFKKVFQKRLQYFHSIKNELMPLLQVFEFLSEAELKPDILFLEDEKIREMGQVNLKTSIFARIKEVFEAKSQRPAENNKEAILNYLHHIKSDYSEINHFKNRLLDFSKEIFHKIGL